MIEDVRPEDIVEDDREDGTWAFAPGIPVNQEAETEETWN